MVMPLAALKLLGRHVENVQPRGRCAHGNAACGIETDIRETFYFSHGRLCTW